jgi:DNA-binding helix-hairpin-helix protein with protein kinase domain
MDLAKGFAIKTKAFKTVKVLEKLGEGGQGAVYKVDYAGQPKALKWYSGKKFAYPDKFYKNLENNIKLGKPTKAFLWPEDITEKKGDAFGYIMDLRPPEYKDFSRFLIGREGFDSVTAMVNASLHIVAGFRELHNKGYSYQDLNDGNFFVNPKTGDVLICDNDNVSEAGKNSGIAGKARYMAPEIVVGKGKKLPNKQTDRFSLSVVLFWLWVRNHPFEGKNACPPCLTASEEQRIYGKSPVFIFDPTDTSNRPVPGTHKGAFSQWPDLPKYLQDEFITAFSKDVLSDPNKRIIEQEWLRLFIKMRGEIYKCSCGAVYFADPVTPNPCPKCKKTNTFPFYIKNYRYNVAVHQRTKLYACHTEKDSDDFETLTGEVAAAGGAFRLKNVSGKNWTITDGGTTIALKPSADVALKKGLKFDFGGGTAEII